MPCFQKPPLFPGNVSHLPLLQTAEYAIQIQCAISPFTIRKAASGAVCPTNQIFLYHHRIHRRIISTDQPPLCQQGTGSGSNCSRCARPRTISVSCSLAPLLLVRRNIIAQAGQRSVDIRSGRCKVWFDIPPAVISPARFDRDTPGCPLIIGRCDHLRIVGWLTERYIRIRT